jgi:hypothetical protein
MKATLKIATTYYLLIVLVAHPITNCLFYNCVFDIEYLFKNVIFEVPIALIIGYLGSSFSKFYFKQKK